MKKQLFTLLLTFAAATFTASSIFAQISLSATTTVSTCSANGSITCTATGGSGGNQFEIIAPATATRPLQSSNIFANVGGNTYTVRVTDNAGHSATANATVQSSYVLPTIVCTLVGSTVTVVVTGGKPNFNYEYSRTNFATIDGSVLNTTSRTATFTCLPNAALKFRVTDDCQNFYTCDKTINLPPLEAVWACGANNTITFGGVNGGEPPYTYFCYRPNGTFLTNTTGAFSGITECRDSLVVHDHCNRAFTQILACQRIQTPMQMHVTCSNAVAGTATITATGGTPPYRYLETTSNTASPNGVFTGLPDADYFFRVTDNCGNFTETLISTLRILPEYRCPWGVSVNTGQITTTTANPNPVTTSFLPVTYKCVNCVPQITKTDATGIGNNTAFFQNVGKGKTIEVTNGCGEKRTLQVDGGDCASVNCHNDIFMIRNNPSTYGTIYTLYNAAGGVVAGPDSLGNYPSVALGTYTVKATNPRMQPTTVTYMVNANVRPLGQPQSTCDSIYVNFCPTGAQVVTKVYLNGVFIKQANAAGVGGLLHSTSYEIKVYTAAGVFVDKWFVMTQGITDIDITATCNSIRAVATGIGLNQHPTIITYVLKNSAGVTVATNTTGIFTNITQGNYTVTASDRYCGSFTKTANAGTTIIKCLKPSFKLAANGTCSFAWDVVFTAPRRITGGPDNVNEQSVVFSNNGTNDDWVRKLRPGTYSVQTDCGAASVILPAPPLPFAPQGFAPCPSAGSIRANAGRTSLEWNAPGLLSYNVCADSSDFYQIYNETGTTLIATQTAWNPNFVNLNAGTTYRVNLLIRDALGILSCPIKTAQVALPFYNRPELTATFGAICGGTTANIDAFVTNGSKPFRFEIINQTVIPAIISQTPNATFTNLTAGNYTIRVSDTCGISADFATSVGPLSFQARASRDCSGNITLCAPTITNATYVWTNGTTSVGTTACAITQNTNAGTYTVSVSLGTCNYSTTVSVAALGTPLTAYAGSDVATLVSPIPLAATPVITGATGTWSVVSPSSGTVTFSNINSPTSNATPSVSPGIYTLVWSVQQGTNGCIVRDTVIVAAQSCTTIPNITATATAPVQPTKCSGMLSVGTAKANPSGGVAPYNYYWSNGLHTQQITNLAVGFYTVTIDDASPCTPPVVKTVEIRAPTPVAIAQSATICAGGSFPFAGGTVTTAGPHVATLKDWNNDCDSAKVTLTLTVLSPTTRMITKTKCPNEIIRINNVDYPMAGHYTNNKIVGFCDSILLDITITDFQATTAQRNLSICIGDSIKIGRKFEKTPGTYLDTIKTWNMGCDSILRSNALSLDAINIVANVTQIKCAELPRGSIEILPTGGTAPYNFIWTSPLLAQQNQTCVERGTYTVTITDAHGCSATELIDVLYDELDGCLQNNEGITPDGDGKNDNWVVPCLVGASNNVVLYNRWGQIVYTKIDYTSEFNGIVNGTILPDGVYYYVIEVRGDLSSSIIKGVHKYRGTLTLIRH